MSNDCKYRPQLDAYHDGELGSEMARQLTEHLATCDGCRRELKAIQRMSALFADSRDEGISLAEVGRVHERVDAEPAGNYFRTARLLIGLAASVLIIGAVWLFDLPGGLTPGTHPVSPGSGRLVQLEPWERVASGKIDVPPNVGLSSPLEDTRYAEARVTQFMVENLQGGPAHGNP